MATLNPLIATLLTMAGERNTITIPRAFVRFTGSLEAAMMLNQLLYWTPRAARAGDAIYKTDRDWQEELCLARYSVRKARERLEAMGFLTTEVRRAQGAPTVHYQLDYERLVECWSDWLKTNNGLSENEQSDYSNSDNGSSENEQTMDRLKTNNESVRNQTNMNKDYTKTPTKITPPPPTPSAPAEQVGGGGSLSREEPVKTELYYWLLDAGIKSPDAAARNQHHDPDLTKAMFRQMVGDAIGDDREKRIGRFMKALTADGPRVRPKPAPPPIAPTTPARPPDRNDRATTAQKLRALQQQLQLSTQEVGDDRPLTAREP
jgi:hypothetical protein